MKTLEDINHELAICTMWHKQKDKQIEELNERLEITIRQRDTLYEELKRLMDWKESEMKIWGPVFDYMRKNTRVKLGEGVSEKTLEFLKDSEKQYEEMQKLKKAMRSIILCLAAHPDNDEGSEFADMISIGHKALNDK